MPTLDDVATATDAEVDKVNDAVEDNVPRNANSTELCTNPLPLQIDQFIDQSNFTERWPSDEKQSDNVDSQLNDSVLQETDEV